LGGRGFIFIFIFFSQIPEIGSPALISIQCRPCSANKWRLI
jgi:hypothetical protein